MASFSRFEIDDMFCTFVNRMLVLRLINSGKSNLSDKQDVIVQEAYNLAYLIVEYAVQKQNIHLLERTQKLAQELVPGEQIKNVMKRPELYDNMVKAKEDFNLDVQNLIARYRATLDFRKYNR